jgi:peptide/nickel transport system substrate-binding protein
MGTTPYDPTRANALLDQAGWKRGADGIRAKNGVKLDLRVGAQDGRPDTDAQLALIQADWRLIGVALNVRHYPAALMFAPPQQGGVVYGNDWDLITFAWAADPIGDYSGIYGCNAFPPAGQNDLRWCNTTAQSAMTALFGHYDPAQRKSDLKIMMRQFIDDAPSIVSYLRVDMFAYRKSLKNYHPNNLTPFDNMMNVDI